jgi:hypothetical protein
MTGKQFLDKLFINFCTDLTTHFKHSFMFMDMNSRASKFCIFTNKQNKTYKNGQTKPNGMNSNPSTPAVTPTFYLKCLNHSNSHNQYNSSLGI